MWPSNSFRHLPALVISPASQPAPAALPFLSPLQVPLADLASATLLSLQILLPPAQPNTTLAAPLHPSNGCPSQYGTMQAALGYWAKVLLNYLDHPFINQLLGAIDHSVHLGYLGPLCSHSCFQSIKNLPMDNEGNAHIHSKVMLQVKEGQLLEVDPQQLCLVCSPVGTVPKLHSTRLWTIHHLSHPCLPCPHQLLSVNDGIATHFTTICYASLTAVLEFVQNNQGCCLWKSDLTDVFQHVVITLDDACLLGFTFNSWFYMEMGITFGGQSSPWIFNLFAEALHWILQSMT
ncbi:hypothetical protein NDA11_001428 [Ustilago hordei]|uniref:Reverse transcriptase domain-containing protein n=1 Tax=Ustilago hordei TaxID=120017 RepID=I2G4L8_USTHO|nr:hypothetical protein NDA10_000096 [Ustilago hordei]KAJ1583187.1 hypothetical protein NDA15_001313 [Ustilago hordei]KAJ1586518.1 hypothetical protein NDA11_001428 [Ustilago hordei]KAJ1592199.1 hypothetical protein NDA12_006436 [Ustilago hordei]CCF54111.1 uncharacterized protein UHOR_00584 [Ustilago hordei]